MQPSELFTQSPAFPSHRRRSATPSWLHWSQYTMFAAASTTHGRLSGLQSFLIWFSFVVALPLVGDSLQLSYMSRPVASQYSQSRKLSLPSSQAVSASAGGPL